MKRDLENYLQRLDPTLVSGVLWNKLLSLLASVAVVIGASAKSAVVTWEDGKSAVVTGEGGKSAIIRILKHLKGFQNTPDFSS